PGPPDVMRDRGHNSDMVSARPFTMGEDVNARLFLHVDDEPYRIVHASLPGLVVLARPRAGPQQVLDVLWARHAADDRGGKQWKRIAHVLHSLAMRHLSAPRRGSPGHTGVLLLPA